MKVLNPLKVLPIIVNDKDEAIKILSKLAGLGYTWWGRTNENYNFINNMNGWEKYYPIQLNESGYKNFRATTILL